MSRVLALVAASAFASNGCIAYAMQDGDADNKKVVALSAIDFGVPALAAIAPLKPDNEYLSYGWRYLIWFGSFLLLDTIGGAIWHCSKDNVKCGDDTM